MNQMSYLKNRLYDIDALSSAMNILSWDKETFLPEGSLMVRSDHLSLLAKITHELFTSSETQKLLCDAENISEKKDEEKALLRVVRREMDHATKLPSKFVEESTKLSVMSHEAWSQARKEDQFELFAPYLEKTVEIMKQKAEYLGYKDHPYDALLDIYEEGLSTEQTKNMFHFIKGPLTQLVQKYKNETEVHPSLCASYDQQKMFELSVRIAEDCGFDFRRGRLDKSTHPFCTNWSVNDVRMTTRYEKFVPSAIFTVLHEAGHGMYEQGSNPKLDRTPLCGGVSLGIHESQSRLWENIVGRSKAYWTHYLPLLQEVVPEIKELTLDEFVKANNRVHPSYIRVDADEVTYNLHVLIRFEIECALMEGNLKVNEIPEVWNQKMQEYLGITPPNNRLGCLQDMHWTEGFGYFPTYTLGNLTSYQIWDTLKKDIPDVEDKISQANLKPIHTWLVDKIYQHGKIYTPNELLVQVTGKSLDPNIYIQSIQNKMKNLFGS